MKDDVRPTEQGSIGVPLTELRPTQMTIGFREVGIKRKQWRDADSDAKSRMLRRHVVPAVVGPKGWRYIVDHHHFIKALLDEGAAEVAVFVQADLQHLGKQEFWSFLDNSAWCHAYNANGERQELSAIPKGFADLKDDPYRSLVAELIRAGGCGKSSKPFSEFLWADYLRRRIKSSLLDADFAAALVQALSLAKATDAKALPGWCGPDPA